MSRPPSAQAPRPSRLFVELERPAGPVPDAYIAHIDGAARGNPGPAAYAVVLRRPTGELAAQIHKTLGRATNNVAEYYALIAALDYAHAHRIEKLRVRSDSELLVRQMQGRYRVKSASLRQLHERAGKLAASLTFFAIEHVPREANREADALANAALDSTARRSATSAQPRVSTRPTGGEARKPKSEDRRIRARYWHGALHPAEPIDLPEGVEVEISIHPLRKDA